MSAAEPRMADLLNAALHGMLDADPDLVLLGEDIEDPYGGAFGVTRGLSSRSPGRVLGTPISEGAIAGVAGGLALAGDRVIVEVMFGDFVTLCFDPIVNFISKSVAMYGRRNPMRVVIRCPIGGNRAYGPTHSQSLQKHFIGVPHLRLYELSPLHPPRQAFDEMFRGDEPAIFFEDKVLYGLPTVRDGHADGLLTIEQLDADANWMRAHLDAGRPDWTIIAPGGVAPRALGAMRSALVEEEIVAQLLVPSRLHPLDLGPVLDLAATGERVMVVEDGVAGGGWAGDVARQLYESLWGRLRHPISVLQPPCAVIPAAPHLERAMLIQELTIHRALTGAGRA
uniref:Putative pyruvate dehydrogenase n=1 Tax=Amycolatopsis sp. SANK 60206 TaxID=1642649 RepID=A0A0E3Z9N0_9PSEU|nr:putative pyruvate dehydrogenase [Amycolatopsis sp. SANK 60206]